MTAVCHRHSSNMRSITLVLLALLTQTVSSGSWFYLDQHSELGVIVPRKLKRATVQNSVSRDSDKTKETLICHGLSLNLNGCVNTSQTEKDPEEKKEEYRYVDKHEVKPHVSYSPTDGPNSILLVTEIDSYNLRTSLNYNHVCSMSALLKSGTHRSNIIALILVQQWKTSLQLSVCKTPSMFYSTRCSNDAFITHPDKINESKQSRSSLHSKCVALILGATLLLVICTIALIALSKVIPVCLSHLTVVMLFTLTMHCFLPSVAVHHLSERSLLASLVWGLGRAVYAAVAGRVVINIMKICHLTQQQTRALSVLLFFFSMIYNFLSGNKNRKHWSSNMHLEGVGSALGYFEQTELLALFYWVFVSFPPLLQTIQTKMNRLRVLFHLQLVTCLQNSRIAKKYELVVEVSGMI
ncbi:uncharacterized protein LOC112149879 isoform X1 [Oryzias melastigma]|uniref:uncharacterized protein LOC112149879 isoform X1 n=1 Tax=Oryzias melastigma TaxID=30732 RepID=UPI00168D4F5E|nr:uncharacterized protein LOC112149879 isoform X1 [Oryzias melastigma]